MCASCSPKWISSRRSHACLCMIRLPTGITRRSALVRKISSAPFRASIVKEHSITGKLHSCIHSNTCAHITPAMQPSARLLTNTVPSFNNRMLLFVVSTTRPALFSRIASSQPTEAASRAATRYGKALHVLRCENGPGSFTAFAEMPSSMPPVCRCGSGPQLMT